MVLKLVYLTQKTHFPSDVEITRLLNRCNDSVYECDDDVYGNDGVALVIFVEANEPCEVAYKDRRGKYQGQTGVTLPKS